MEFKKCVRCGCFYTSEGEVCCSCANKDKKDIYNLNSYIVNSNGVPNVNNLAYGTGISMKNINRFIENNSIANL